MKNGFVLITCLSVVIVVALGIAGILQATGSHANMKAFNLQEAQARYLAEAGMEQAIWQCRPGGGGGCSTLTYSIEGTNNVTATVSALGGGRYSIQVVVNFPGI